MALASATPITLGDHAAGVLLVSLLFLGSDLRLRPFLVTHVANKQVHRYRGVV